MDSLNTLIAVDGQPSTHCCAESVVRMTLNASSIYGVTSQDALSSSHAIETAKLYDVTSTNFSAKLIRFPCRVYLNQPVFKDKTAQQLERHRSRFTHHGTILFAIHKENDKAQGGISQTCANDSIIEASDKKRSLKKSKEGVFLVVAELRSRVSGDAINKGNLLDKLKAIQLYVLAMEQWNASQLKVCDRRYLVSATNLIHYLALRSLDVQQLNDDLSSIGLINLENISPHVLASLSAASQMLDHLKLNFKDSVAEEIHFLSLDKQEGDLSISKMKKQASFNKQSLLGALQNKKTTHIMVTVGAEVLESETRIDDLLKAGTTIIRINCAHGNPSLWSEIIKRVKRSSQMLEKPCQVLMDLAGPKFRTNKPKTGPCVMEISPEKNTVGEVIFPAQVWLCPKQVVHPPANFSPDAVIHVDGDEFLGKLELGDVIKFSDARGKQRTLNISKKIYVSAGVGFMAECSANCYVQSGTELRIKGKKGKSVVVDVPAAEQFLRLRVGDLLTISRDSSTNQHESPISATQALKITCSSGSLFDSVKPGEPIAFDDGIIWGIIQETSMSEIVVSITHAEKKGSKLSSGKSINLPESDIQYESLTSKDLVDLDFVAAHADMVGVSFVRDVHDIVVLRKELEKRKLKDLGIILKIETKSGFEKLPLMLLEAMKSPNPLGVMIARGDLAVECGWERLADIQDEILHICRAAHVPVIWATQVLESLVVSGVPTRAEITDVHSGKRASCIMLNKGQYIVKGVSTLETILHGSSMKVKTELRPLVLSSHFF